MKPLTPRQREIVRLIVTGMPDKAIAGRLFRSIRTVQNHAENAKARLGVKTRIEMAVIVTRRPELIA